MRPWHSERSQPLIYSISSCVRTRMNRNSLKWHLVERPVTYDFTLHLRVRDHTTWVWRCRGTAFGHFLWGTHNSMVTFLACVWHGPYLQTPNTTLKKKTLSLFFSKLRHLHYRLCWHWCAQVRALECVVGVRAHNDWPQISYNIVFKKLVDSIYNIHYPNMQ
jgi:hypothetical protein